MVHRNIDDPAPASLQHDGHGVACHQEWSIHIGVNHHAPSLRIDFPKPCRLSQKRIADVLHAATCVIDQDVKSTEALDCSIDDAPTVILLCNIGNQRQDSILTTGLQHLASNSINL